MSLALGTGPFGPRPGGDSNYTIDSPAHILYLEDSPRRLRVRFGGEDVADSRRARVLFETGHLPVPYFPLDDVRTDLLEETDHSTHCPFKGDASYWTIRAGDSSAENAVWTYREPIASAPPLAGYAAFQPKAIDAWLEEDEELLGHPHDPYHRVDVRDTSRHVRVTVDGEPLAESGRPKILFETGLPARYYLPPDDVRRDLLEPSATATVCPYKGRASYWSLVGDDDTAGIEDVAWAYADPLPEAWKARDQLAFAPGARLRIEVDGRPLDA
jgi:uncharacterized protein (DUF427 family)